MSRTWEYIEWIDAYSSPDTNKISRNQLKNTIDHSEVVCGCAGCVVHEDGKVLTLVSWIWDTKWDGEPHEDCAIGPYLRIPMSLIIKRKKLKV